MIVLLSLIIVSKITNLFIDKGVQLLLFNLFILIILKFQCLGEKKWNKKDWRESIKLNKIKIKILLNKDFRKISILKIIHKINLKEENIIYYE